MDAEQYFTQIRCMRHVVEGVKLEMEEARMKLDMLKGISYDGMSGGVADPDAIAAQIERMEELSSVFEERFTRWAALFEQGCCALDRARGVLLDGYAHAIDLAHIEIVHRYYILGQHRATIADDMGYSISNVDERKRRCLDWMDHARDADGYPIVPLVSE